MFFPNQSPKRQSWEGKRRHFPWNCLSGGFGTTEIPAQPATLTRSKLVGLNSQKPSLTGTTRSQKSPNPSPRADPIHYPFPQCCWARIMGSSHPHPWEHFCPGVSPQILAPKEDSEKVWGVFPWNWLCPAGNQGTFPWDFGNRWGWRAGRKGFGKTGRAPGSGNKG